MNNKKFISEAKNVINLEIKALQKLKKNINKSFNEAVISIAKCQSKVVLCGVGKSGLIASKIAATLASVGSPSFSLSASEASRTHARWRWQLDLLSVRCVHTWTHS